MKPIRTIVLKGVLLGLLGLGTTVLAHDFWLAGSIWHAAPGATVMVSANVGDRFPKPTSYTAPERVASIELVGPADRRPLEARFRRDDNRLAFDVTLPSQATTYMVVMTIKPRFIELKPPDFASYLRSEGLERVIAERERLSESSTPGRERYARYAKLLIHAGDGEDGHVTRPVGLKAELVPSTNPVRARVGDPVTFRLLVDGKAVDGALVGAVYAGSVGAPDEWPLKSRTNRDGEVEFRLAEPGPWLVRTVHMARLQDETGAEAPNWESSWASIAFDIRK